MKCEVPGHEKDVKAALAAWPGSERDFFGHVFAVKQTQGDVLFGRDAAFLLLLLLLFLFFFRLTGNQKGKTGFVCLVGGEGSWAWRVKRKGQKGEV